MFRKFWDRTDIKIRTSIDVWKVPVLSHSKSMIVCVYFMVVRAMM